MAEYRHVKRLVAGRVRWVYACQYGHDHRSQKAAEKCKGGR